MNEELLKIFIEKLASSSNPVLANMGAEMTGISLPTANPGAGVADPQQKDYAVDQTVTAPNAAKPEQSESDEIDTFMQDQMPELDEEQPTGITTMKISEALTYGDLLRQRLGL